MSRRAAKKPLNACNYKIIIKNSIVTSDKNLDTEAANFVKIYICVILKTFGHDCSMNKLEVEALLLLSISLLQLREG